MNEGLATVALCPFCQTGKLVLEISGEVVDLGQYRGTDYHTAYRKPPIIKCLKCGRVWRPDH